MTASWRRSSGPTAATRGTNLAGHGDLEPGGGELGAHPVGADGEHGPNVGRVSPQMLDGGRRRGHDLVRASLDPHRAQPLDVPLARDHRVVRREPDRDAGGVEEVDQLTRAADRLVAPIHDAVEVEDHQAHAIGEVAHGAR